ncbi:IclR family transcriptional regulator [Pontibacillus halophilus JSM 076056 = DSM 19796]|uniref:IclR family transcriptional regulator n=1 Tax=Pontibacillus halophilus JSM 076056 = DSM 19796 TaxID=1385510 RepID=A0A0A5GDR1_9BACI|nr:IclR family transcriptional regulator [Pontibacillus halophilus]KGX91351.1 IclR family transcriptional regulator [Pontibacillus halophilus JSM 076056 = DSM 19796]
MSQYEVSTLKKGLLILDALMEHGEMTMSEVMHHMKLNKTTAFRMLYTLEHMGYIHKKGHSYQVSTKLGTYKQSHQLLVDWSSVPPLYELSHELGETMYIGILDGTDVVTTQVVDGTHAMRIHSQVGDRDPAHGSALGKAIVAFFDERKQRNYLQQLKWEKRTENTFDDEQLFLYHLKAIRNQGFAVDDEETEIGLRCIAAPIYHNGEVVAAVALSGPASRIPKQQDTYHSKKIRACSAQISTLL